VGGGSKKKGQGPNPHPGVPLRNILCERVSGKKKKEEEKRETGEKTVKKVRDVFGGGR